MKREGLVFLAGALIAIVNSSFVFRDHDFAGAQRREGGWRTAEAPDFGSRSPSDGPRDRRPASEGHSAGDFGLTSSVHSAASRKSLALAPFQQLKEAVFADYRSRMVRIEELGFQLLNGWDETAENKAILETLAARPLPRVEIDQSFRLEMDFYWKGQHVQIWIDNSGRGNVRDLVSSGFLVFLRSRGVTTLISAEGPNSVLLKGSDAFLYLDLASCSGPGFSEMQGLIIALPGNPTDRSAMVMRGAGDGVLEITQFTNWRVAEPLSVEFFESTSSRCHLSSLEFFRKRFQDP